jgi:hypothetical protein
MRAVGGRRIVGLTSGEAHVSPVVSITIVGRWVEVGHTYCCRRHVSLCRQRHLFILIKPKPSVDLDGYREDWVLKMDIHLVEDSYLELVAQLGA